jgi:hypothetical protein
MSDLISRKALLDIVENKYRDIVAGAYPFNIVAHDLSQIIKEQPTAFDIEAVVKEVERYLKAVEQLECPHDYSDGMCERYSYCSKCRDAWLLRIIRKGGVKRLN